MMKAPGAYRIFVGLVMMILCAWGTAQTVPTARVIIKVADQSGAGIAGARVRVVPAPDAAAVATETDKNGELQLNLKVGGHGIFVCAQGFKSFVEHIEVRSGAEAQVIPAELRVADMFSPRCTPSFSP
jgi:hypothetical protein